MTGHADSDTDADADEHANTNTDLTDALLEHADREPIAFDGLRLEATDDGYAVETPAVERTGLSERDLREALADENDDVREYASNWYYWQQVGGEGTARRAFLRWCERAPLEDAVESEVEGEDSPSTEEPLTVPERYEVLASGGDGDGAEAEDGLERQWGQLVITVRLADGDGNENDSVPGDRVYDLRHVDDRGTDPARLERHDRPRDARDLTTYDERGRYRPLKTAPTLVSGWVFTGLSGDQLVDAVEFVYPATVANWHRERRGNLDVDHWLETAERQTGIYDIVDELPREAVEWMAEACCVDSQCLRRREWEYEEGDELSVDGGDGPFPCREPCSIVIAAARKWAILETEAERTWEFELTTSEKNQLEALIDAVADGRVDEIREADLNRGANRYRARYLRAKRVDDEGNLGGVDSSVDE